MADPIKIEGLRDFQKKLKDADGASQKKLRLVLNAAANVVIDEARPKIPVLTGAAAASLKAQSSQRLARVKAGGAKVPYYGWLDFGGSVGRQHAIKRPFLRDGRYIYPSYDAKRDAILKALEQGISDLAKEAGLL